VYPDFYSRVKSIIARCKGTRHLPVWQRALACSTALALLVSLLWLAPWQARHNDLATAPQPMPIQASDPPAVETAQPTPQPLVTPPAASTGTGQVSEVATGPAVPTLQSPALLTEQSKASRVDPGQERHTPTTSEEPMEVLDTQAMQGLVTRLEAARSSPEEHLDTRAMDRLLARLEPTDKPASPPAPRSKVPRKRARGSPRAAADRGAPGTVSPPRADAAPLRAASELPFPDIAR
jgi:hypothetical protein